MSLLNRAVLVQLGFYFHMQRALLLEGGGSAAATAAAAAAAATGATASAPFMGLALTRPLAFATSFMLLFSVVIALFKDIPDVVGDRQVGVGGWGRLLRCAESHTALCCAVLFRVV